MRLITIPIILIASALAAQEFQLSPTFGAGGIVRTNIWEGSEVANSHVILPNGTLVVAGTGYWNTPNSFHVTMAAVDTVCGLLDQDFGSGGILAHTFEQRTTCNHIMLQADGKIVGAGVTAPSNAGSAHKPSVYRYNMDGSVDSTFNGTGYNKSSFDPISSGAFWRCFEDADGKITCVGYSTGNINGGANGIGAQRFNADGTLDATFSDDGITRITTSGTGYSVSDIGNGILLPDGKVLVVAIFSDGAQSLIGMARFTADGTPDPSFGIQGLLVSTVVTATSPGSAGLGALRAGDGAILVSTTSAATPAEFLMARFQPDGSLDTDYGVNGISLAQVGTAAIGRRAAFTADGGTLQFGTLHSNDGPPAIVKRLADGSLDPDLGTNGLLQITPSVTSYEKFWGGLELPSGRIIGYGEGSSQIVIARFTADPGSEHLVDLGEDQSICPGESITLDAGDPNNTFLWSDGSTGSTFIADTAGSIEVTVTDPIGCSDSDMIEIELLEAPPAPVISSVNGIDLTTDAIGDLQWYLDGTAIPGENSMELSAGENGTYTVEVTNDEGCTSASDPFEVLTVGISDHASTSFTLHPNPATDVLWIPIGYRWITAEAIDATGRTIALAYDEGRINIAHLTPGAYTLRLAGNGKPLHSRFIKQ